MRWVNVTCICGHNVCRSCGIVLISSGGAHMLSVLIWGRDLISGIVNRLYYMQFCWERLSRDCRLGSLINYPFGFEHVMNRVTLFPQKIVAKTKLPKMSWFWLCFPIVFILAEGNYWKVVWPIYIRERRWDLQGTVKAIKSYNEWGL